MPRLKVICEGGTTMSLNSLTEFQGNLKDLDAANFAKLRKTITRKGFAFPVSVWSAPDGHNYILDGHQRVRVVTTLKAEGWEIPDLPCNRTFANTVEEAKEILLAGAGQYGIVSDQGLYELIMQSELDFSTVREETNFFGVDYDEFQANFFDEQIPSDAEPKEYDVCQSCGKKSRK